MTISKQVAALTFVALIALYWVLPHREFPNYGHFADDARGQLNVLSNLAFILVGVPGLLWTTRHRRELDDDYPAALTFFLGVIATAFGSAYFHLRPLELGQLNRGALFWDRLPITIAFAGLLALVLRDRVFHRPNRFALPLLTIAGIATVLYWYWSHDLYPYGFFQLYTGVGTLLMIAMLRPSYTEAGYLVAAIAFFAMSKVFEDFDHQIYAHWPMGGHPLKHVISAAAALTIWLWLMKRRARA